MLKKSGSVAAVGGILEAVHAPLRQGGSGVCAFSVSTHVLLVYHPLPRSIIHASVFVSVNVWRSCGRRAHAHGKVQLSTLLRGVVAGSIQRLCVPTISLHRRPLDGWPGFRLACWPVGWLAAAALCVLLPCGARCRCRSSGTCCSLSRSKTGGF